jgi:hypothetical protein
MVFSFDFDRLRSGPFEGPAIVKPPALPGDTYSNDFVCYQKQRCLPMALGRLTRKATEETFRVKVLP